MTQSFIPVFRPALPKGPEIAPYIAEIDTRRHYTNRGPLVERLEARLAALFGLREHAVRTASSGTSAIEVAILAHAGAAKAERPLALIPSFTFAATALAAERCGYQPFFLDIDGNSWTLDHERVARHPVLARTGVILPVAPFGVLPDMRALEALQDATGVPVVVDAAAAFEAVVSAQAAISDRVPLTLSFHATKSFSSGEGGAVLWNDPRGQARVVQSANFGFFHSREARVPGTNAKLSEYHAAVGLAMLDGLAQRRADWLRVASLWRAHSSGRDLGGRLHLSPRLSSAYVLLETESPRQMERTEAHLYTGLVETRRWYEGGLHMQPHFTTRGRDPMPMTESLSERLLGLPMAHDLDEKHIIFILDRIAEAASTSLRDTA